MEMLMQEKCLVWFHVLSLFSVMQVHSLADT